MSSIPVTNEQAYGAARGAAPYAGAIAVVAAAGVIAFWLREYFPVESLALLFLVAVLLAARWWGRWPSIFASLVSFLVYDFFFTEPFFELAIADKGLVLTLALFLVVAVLMGDLSARLRERIAAEQAAAARQARLASEMEEAQLVAERERLRAALLSSVSHDLRTPLVSIIGAASSLLEAPDAINADNRRALVETILEEGERLNRYVQNLLDMTRISGGPLPVNREWIDLRELVGSALRQLRRELAGHRVRVDIPADLPPIKGDVLLLEQALINVLDNAGKYSPTATEITITGRAADGRLQLRLADRGAGIPVADRERVFDMFYRVNAGDRQSRGTGLGLAIARGIIQAHGGTIRAGPAADGRGTAIEIDLLLTTADASALQDSG